MKGVLLGCGAIGSEYALDPKMKGVNTHAGALRACQDTELVGVCDVNAEKAKACAAHWGLKTFYTDFSRMLETEKPEIVSIATPNHLHAQQIREAVLCPSVRGVLAEKPLASSSGEATELLELARARNVKIAVNYTRRFSPGFIRCHDMIEAGELGRIQNVSGYYTKGLLHNGTHWLDLARWLVGDIVEAHGSHNRNESAHHGFKDAQVDGHFVFVGGATGTLVGLDASAFSLFEMDIVGTKGRFKILDSGNTIQHFEVADSPFNTGYRTLLPRDEIRGEMHDALLTAMQNLVASIEGRTSLICSGDDGLEALAIAERLLGRKGL